MKISAILKRVVQEQGRDLGGVNSLTYCGKELKGGETIQSLQNMKEIYLTGQAVNDTLYVLIAIPETPEKMEIALGLRSRGRALGLVDSKVTVKGLKVESVPPRRPSHRVHKPARRIDASRPLSYLANYLPSEPRIKVEEDY